MKTIITTVGVSLFENYQKYNAPLDDLESFECAYSDDEWGYSRTTCEEISAKIIESDWIRNNPKASAEIKSLLKIRDYLGEIRTILITSDTLKGYLVGKILETLLPDLFGIPVDRVERIKGLNIKNEAKENISEGFDTYIRYLVGNTYAGMAYNISGGYKAIIPISTLVASWKSVPLYYIYEDSEYLVDIPPFPFQFDTSICRLFRPIFEKIEQQAVLEEDDAELTSFLANLAADKRDIFHALTIQHDGITFSTVGQIIWHDYSQSLQLTLLPTDQKPQDKTIKLRDDHGKDVLKKFGKRLCNNEYVEGVVNSLPFNPKERNFIRNIFDNGQIELVLYWTDAGLGMIIQTTGRNKRETEAIANILQDNYT